MSLASSKVHRPRLAFGKVFQPQNVSFGKIIHMDIVADASAVGCGIVVAEDLKSGALALDCLQNEWYQMRLRIMVFPNLSALVGSRSVEISKGDEAQAVGMAVRFQRIFQRQLGGAVGIHRLTRTGLGDGRFVRSAIDGGG